METKTERLARCYANLQKWGEVDSPDLEWLLDEINKDRALLRACLGDYGDVRFTDRHGMADRLRARLGIRPDGAELRDQGD